MSRPVRHRRTALAAARRVVASSVALIATTVVLFVAPASAHGGPGTIAVVSRTESGPLKLTYTVKLTFQGDGDAAGGATVTALADLTVLGNDVMPASGKGSVPPVIMMPTAVKGEYKAELEFPFASAWTVRFTSIEPPATLEDEVQVVRPTTTAAPTTAAAPTTLPPTSTPASVTAAAATTTSATDDSDDGGSNALPWIIGGIAAIGVAVAVALVSRRRS